MIKEPIKSEITTEENTLYLYGTIGDDWDGVTLKQIQRAAKPLNKEQVTIYINSYGGDATEGVAIRNYLINTFDRIDVYVEGIAASAASVIATCGETLTMPTGTTFMIHNPWTIAFGNRQDLLKEIGALESLEQSYRSIYMEKFTGSEKDLAQLMEDESWLTAEEAEQFGFANEIETVEPNSNEEQEDNTLVATLLSKYAAKVDDENNPTVQTDSDNQTKDSSVDNRNDDDKEKEKEKDPKQNNFLSNLVKTFS